MPIGTYPEIGCRPAHTLRAQRAGRVGFRMRHEIVVQRPGNPLHLGELVERQRLAARIARPVEILNERLIARAQLVRPRGERPLHLEISDDAVAVQIEIHERRAADVPVVIDEILRQASSERARRLRALIVRAQSPGGTGR